MAPRGAGRVALSLITGTARWRRSGLADTYAAYWSRLLAAIAPEGRDAPRWSIATPGPWTVGQPVAIEAASERPLAVALVAAPGGALDTVFLARDRSGRWRGIYWPAAVGWYGIAGDDGPAFYAQSADRWIGVRAAARLASSRRAAVIGEDEERTPATALVVPARPVPLRWIFLLFLASVATLWAQRRRVPTRGSRADSAT